MAQQAPPIVFQQLLDLPALGISANNCTFQTLTMESEKYICVREPALGPNEPGHVVIVDMEKPHSPVRHAITADSAIMNPTQYILALKSAQTLQIFSIAEKTKLKSFVMQDPVVYWRWLTPSLLGIITSKSVYHWDMTDAKTDPVKMYDRLKELNDHQIISYRADAALKWFCLVGLSQENGRIVGWTQLYSSEKNIAQPLKGQAATFAKYTLPGTNQELTLFCFAYRTAGESKLVIREVNRSNSPTDSGTNKFGQVASIFFPEEAAADFPVSMEVSPKYDVIYMVTKMGYLHIFDIATGKLVYMNKVAQDKDTIFVTTSYKGGILGVNRAGKVLSINLNEQTIIPYILSKNDLDLATKLACRANLPGADDLFNKQFQVLIQSGKYAEAARIAAEAPAGLLRTPQTINLFKSLPARVNEAPPILQYFGALMERGKLNKNESTELVRMVTSQGRKDLIEKWLKEDKLEWTDEIGELVRPLDLKLALMVFVRAECKEKVVFILAETGQFEQLVSWCHQQNYTPDWLKIITALCTANPPGAVALAKLLITAKPSPVDRNAVVEIFIGRNMVPQTTELLLDVLHENKPEDGPLQTKVLELNLLQVPAVAEDILRTKLFSHFNHKRIAELCEKAGLHHRALELYTDLTDRKRVLRSAHTIQPPEFVVEWFSQLGPKDSIECLKEMLVANPRANLPVVVLICQRFWEALTPQALIGLFEGVKSFEGIYHFLNPLLPLINDADVHFKFIEAAARLGHFADVERVCRESKVYNPERVRDFLKEIKLSDPLPLIVVCDTYGYVADLVKYLSKNSMRKAIEIYVTQINADNTPTVIGTLLDVDETSGDDFIKHLLNAVGSRCPVEPLVDEVEKRNRLKLLQAWLESRAREGNQDPALHNALAKIYIDIRNDPEKFLTENRFYDHKNVGKYCEGRDPALAFLAYSTARGTCDDEIISISNRASLFKQLAKYLIQRRDLGLWGKVLSEENIEHRRTLVDQVQAILPESTVAEDVVVTVKAFMEPHLNLNQELIGLVEKIIFEGSNPEFATYSNLQNLLILTAIRAHTPETPTRVMEYIKRLDKYEVDAIAESAIDKQLYEEAFVAFQKFLKPVNAIDVLINNIHSLDRAADFAEQVDRPEVYSRLGKAQLDASQVSEAINSFIKATDAQYYHEVIGAVNATGEEKMYHELIKFLLMARKQLSESKIDSELIYSYAKTSSFVEMEQFLQGTHRANVQDIGERCFDEGNYQAAKVLFQSINSFGRLATTLVKLNDLAAAVEMARKANSVATWKAISKACVEAQNFKLARTCGLNIIVHGDELSEIIRFYENRGYSDELLLLLEAGLEHERAHPGMFTELAVLYAQYKPEKLMEHLRHHHQTLNPGRVSIACEQNYLWRELAYLLQQDKSFDRCAAIMMDHPEAFDAQQFPLIVAKSTSTENITRAIRFYIDEHPASVNELLSAVSGRVDNRRVIEVARDTQTLPLIKGYLQKVQEANVQVVNEALNDIYLDEEDYNALRTSIETYNAFEPIALAKRLERHELVEFRRIAATLYKQKGKWSQAIDLLKGDKLFEDAMVAAADSKDGKIAEDLLNYFISQGHPDAFAAALCHCYDLVRPDVVLELAWKNKILDFAFPYLIQYVREYTTKVDQLAEAMLKRREEVQAIQAQTEAVQFGTQMGTHMMTTPAMMATAPFAVQPAPFAPQPAQFGSNPMPGVQPMQTMSMGALPPHMMTSPMLGPSGPFAPPF